MDHRVEDKSEDTVDAEEDRAIEERAPIAAPAIFEAIRRQGEAELNRPISSLAASGFIAGIALGFSALTKALLQSHLPDTEWRPLVSSLGYTVGFLIVILGQLQLFTENTITAVCPALDKPGRESLRCLLRLWGIVLTFNLIGAGVFGYVLYLVADVQPGVWDALVYMADKALGHSWLEVLLRGVGAGWLVASLVWVMSNADSKTIVIVIFTYLIALAGFAHVIAGTAEAAAMIFAGEVGVVEAVWGYILPALLGNIIGGTVLFTGLTWAQLRAEVARDRPPLWTG